MSEQIEQAKARYIRNEGSLDDLVNAVWREAVRVSALPKVLKCVACENGDHVQCLGGRCECIHERVSALPPENDQPNSVGALDAEGESFT